MKSPRVLSLVLVYAVISLFSCQTTEKRPLSLNPLFSDHMVLQQDTDVTFWGMNSPNQTVTIKSGWGTDNTAVTDENGNWHMMLSTPVAGGPYDIKILTSDTSMAISDVMIGEVWLASGQSNMQMPLSGYMPNEPIDNYEEEIKNAKHSQIRMFTVERVTAASVKSTLNGEWQVCSPETAGDFSAAGYFFARKLNQELDVPVGIIHSSWGGTEVEAWMSKDGLKEFPDMIKEAESFDEDKINNWKERFVAAAAPTTIEELENFDMNDADIIQPGFDDQSWPKIVLPHQGCLASNFIPGFDTSVYLNGAFWYRKTFIVEDNNADYVLHMGSIDDGDITYVNGRKIGSTLNWQASRDYKVPASLLNLGENTVVIKHYDSAGGSNVVGPLYLQNETGERISLEGEWSGLFYGDISHPDMIMYGLNHQEELKERPISINFGPNDMATSLFNGMINPLIPYAIKGAIWYQGESNVGRAKQYEKLFPAMIVDWRSQWESEFPFYFVQIAPFQYGSELSPALRDAQRKSLTTPQTGMAIAMDVGHPTSIHPGNKQDIGLRLAHLALAKDYGKDLIASGPLYNNHSRVGNKIVVKFDFVGSGLEGKDGVLSGFEIAGADLKYVPAKAVIIDEHIEVSAATISDPEYVRYAWKDYFSASLFNKEGLPASSFSTEN